MTIKILIGPDVCGLRIRAEVVAELFECFPDLFDEPFELDDFFGDLYNGKSETEIAQDVTHSFVQDGKIYFLKDGNALRTNSLLLRKFEEGGVPAVSSSSRILKVVEIPEGVDWYIFTDDDGSETIHERHRTWS